MSSVKDEAAVALHMRESEVGASEQLHIKKQTTNSTSDMSSEERDRLETEISTLKEALIDEQGKFLSKHKALNQRTSQLNDRERELEVKAAEIAAGLPQLVEDKLASVRQELQNERERIAKSLKAFEQEKSDFAQQLAELNRRQAECQAGFSTQKIEFEQEMAEQAQQKRRQLEQELDRLRADRLGQLQSEAELFATGSEE